MNRQKVMQIALGVGVVFLIFYWTHLGFNSAVKNTKSSIKTTESKIKKAVNLLGQVKKGGDRSQPIKSGLLSFLQTSAQREGLSTKIGSIKPKTVPGVQEAATIRLDGLNYNELVSFLRSIERFGNISSTNVKISKRFDNEALLNLVMDVIKK